MDRRITGHNRRLAKKRVQYLYKALCFVSSLVVADSIMLRNMLPLHCCQTLQGILKTKIHDRMRYVLIFIFSITFTLGAKGQSINIDSCGLDNKSILTKWEMEYFKESIKTLKSIELENKLFAFAYGNSGNTVISKRDYFEKWGRDYYKGNADVPNILISLTEEEKSLSGGYDFIIVSYSKTVIAGESRIKLIERVKRYTEANQL
jgi:hypothetical protein